MQQEKCSMEKNINSKKNGSTIYATEPSVKDTGQLLNVQPTTGDFAALNAIK